MSEIEPTWVEALTKKIEEMLDARVGLGIAEIKSEEQSLRVKGYFLVGARQYEYEILGPFWGES